MCAPTSDAQVGDMENSSFYFAKSELDYRRDRVMRQWRPVTRRRRERAEAVRRVISHLR